jgi:hypothetical protein
MLRGYRFVEDVGYNVDRLMVQNVFQLWICRAVVLGGLMILAQRLWSFCEGMGERGSKSFFVKFEKFICLEPRKFNL